jgi:hypothetical protein
MTFQSGDTYETYILPQTDGTQVEYYIKAEDNDGLRSTSATFNYTVTMGGGIIPIADIQNNPGYIGQQVTIEGIVTLGAGVTTTSWTDAYVQDSSGRGINIYQSDTVDPDLNRNNKVQITGTVDEYNGVTEIVNYSVQVIATNQPLPDSLHLSTNDANNTTYEGTLIYVQGTITDKYVSGEGTNIIIDDGSGAATIRAWDTANLNLNSYNTGDTVGIKGVMDVYQSNAQLLLAYQEDISLISIQTDVPQISNISQSPSAPTLSDTVFITADVTDNGTIVSVKLFTSVDSSPFDSTDMTFQSGDTYEAYILPQANGTQVEYYIKAEDNDGLISISSTFNYTVSSDSAPNISNIIQLPSSPTSIDTVKISADVTDNGTITSVKLFFSINSSPFDSTDMTFQSGDTYEVYILPQVEGTQVEYYIKAEDNGGLSSVSTIYSYVVISGTTGDPHLLFTEISVVPTAGEFVEIYNNTNSTIDLSNYYFTDATYTPDNSFYYNIVTGANAGGGGFGDFHARFPAGSSIAAGEFQTIAMDGAGFSSTYGAQPTYELFDTDSNISDMLEALTGSINGQGGLTNTGEMVILYYWDGQSDLVQDIDYVVWGDKNEAVEKTGVSIDGPDPDVTATAYLNDTPIAQQISVSSADPHSAGESIQRLNFNENSEIQSGGNGITGHDETSEDLATSFQVGNPNPGSGPTSGNAPVLSNINHQPAIPSPTDTITVFADITDNGTIVDVKLFISINSSPFDSTDMILQSGNTYKANIDPQAENTQVQYYIKAEDNDGLVSTSSTFNFTVTSAGGITPIANIQNNPAYIGQQVTIEGVVTLGGGITISSRTDTYIQDNSGRGINVFSFDPPDTGLLKRRNLLRVSGTVGEYNNVTQIENFSIQLIDTNQSLPQALSLSTLDANDISYEGTYIQVKGIISEVFWVGGGTNITIDDGSGSVVSRVWDSTNVDISNFNINDTISITGVMDIFDGNSQILLAYQDEIEFTTLEISGDGSGIVTVSPDSAVISETTSISFTITGNSPDTVTNISVSIPNEWDWSGLESDVTPGIGPVFENSNVSVNGNLINLNNVSLANNSEGNMTISNLITPNVDTVSQFIFRTATQNGILTEINEHPIILVGEGTRKTIVPLDSIQQNISKWNGKNVYIKGVVSIGSGILRTDQTDAFVQDTTGYGINVFSFDPPDEDLVRGNLVLISGLIEEYLGTTEITDYTLRVLRKNDSIPAVRNMSTSAATEIEFEGSFVRVAGEIISNFYAGGGTNIELNDGSGIVTLRIWDTANLDLTDFNEGDNIVAKGVINEYSGVGQILVGYQTDIQHIELPESPLFLEVPNKPFLPERGEILAIKYSAGDNNTNTTMRIYDLAGRLVTTLLDETGSSFANVKKWNGRNQVNDLVPLGAYILHYEVVNNTSGKSWQKVAPIVVGTVLR